MPHIVTLKFKYQNTKEKNSITSVPVTFDIERAIIIWINGMPGVLIDGNHWQIADEESRLKLLEWAPVGTPGKEKL